MGLLLARWTGRSWCEDQELWSSCGCLVADGWRMKVVCRDDDFSLCVVMVGCEQGWRWDSHNGWVVQKAPVLVCRSREWPWRIWWVSASGCWVWVELRDGKQRAKKGSRCYDFFFLLAFAWVYKKERVRILEGDFVGKGREMWDGDTSESAWEEVGERGERSSES